jgi:CBS domain-containing protein
MQIKDVMNTKLDVIHPDDTLAAATTRMRTAGVDLLPVCENDRLVGVLTGQDVSEHAGAVGLAAGQARVRDAMDRNVVWCYEDQETSEAERLVAQHSDGKELPAVVVLDHNQRLVGVLPASAFHLDYEHARLGGMAGGPIEDIVSFDEDAVDFMSDESFPASDPLPPPSSVAPESDEGS